MTDLLRNIIQFLGSNWLAIVQVLVVIWMATIATFALNTWKCQIKAQKQIDFIDELTDTIHTFILSMPVPVSSLMFAKIGINAHIGIHEEPEDIKNPEAVAFIKRRGKDTGESIQKQLDAIRPIISKMKSLVAKGQVFGIENYSQCQNACDMLEWSYNQIEAFSVIIRNPNLNWNHPDIQRTLDKALSITPEHIESNLAEQNSAFILFARQAYNKILK